MNATSLRKTPVVRRSQKQYIEDGKQVYTEKFSKVSPLELFLATALFDVLLRREVEPGQYP